MRTRMLLPALLVAIVSAATLGASPALGAADTVYCLNGVSTTLPVSLSASSASQGTRTFSYTEYFAGIDIGWGGVSYHGFDPGLGVWRWLQTPTDLEPGYLTVTIALGPCAAGAGLTHIGVCKLLDRSDGTKGLFQHIAVADWNDAEGPYFDAPAASWVEGLGLTCDDPAGLGYRATGNKVAWGGKPDPNHDPRGVRGSGFNDIYPLFTAA